MQNKQTDGVNKFELRFQIQVGINVCLFRKYIQTLSFPVPASSSTGVMSCASNYANSKIMQFLESSPVAE